MIYRALVPSLLLLFLPAAVSSARPSPVAQNPRLAEILRLPALRSTDWNDLFSLAEAGDFEAQYWLGTIYDRGRLLPQDKNKADFWLQKSAARGYARAEFLLCGQHAGKDAFEGERCLWRAAEKGVPEAQLWLGIAFRDNWFGVTDREEELKWIREAAGGGNPDAEADLGMRYERGDGVEQDYAQAAVWYRRAAEHVPDLGGAGQGRYHLGELYWGGHGVKRDYVEAYRWISLSNADQLLAQVEREMTSDQISQARKLAADWKKQHPDPVIY